MNHAPAEIVRLAPEALEVANKYLTTQNVSSTANQLGMDPEQVAQYLSRSDIRAYINNVYFDAGYNNRFTMRRAMDTIINKKFQEMEETGLGSDKDIVDILALSHKMTMDVLDRELQLEKIKQGSLRSQVNVQINEGSDGTRYGSLIAKLLEDTSPTK